MPDTTSNQDLLVITGLQAGYGGSTVLNGIDMVARAGEVVTLLGRNGMGKSTTVKCISGLLRASAGSIRFAGREMVGLASHKVGQAGVGLVPEGRQVFPTLSVRENLVATGANRHGSATPWTLERIYGLFPRLRERATQSAGKLSGGEQQMLAVGRALMTNPRLLVLDEATEGLAPLIRHEIWQCLGSLKASGQAMIVIDKNLTPLLPLADRHYIIEKGSIAWAGSSADLRANSAIVHRYLGV